jgi:hypothetical protein
MVGKILGWMLEVDEDTMIGELKHMNLRGYLSTAVQPFQFPLRNFGSISSGDYISISSKVLIDNT